MTPATKRDAHRRHRSPQLGLSPRAVQEQGDDMSLPLPYEIINRTDVAAVEAERKQCAERVRLVSRIERLRGLCKTAVGMLHDAGRDDDAEVISELIGDMEV